MPRGKRARTPYATQGQSPFKKRATSKSPYRAKAAAPRAASRSKQSYTMQAKFPGSRARARSKGVGKKHYKKGKGYKFPKWFVDLLKQQTPSALASQKTFDCRNASAGSKQWFSAFKCKSMNDISHTTQTAGLVTSAASTPASNAYKAYMYNYVRKHTWRNNQGKTSAVMSFYQCIPRNDIPIAGATLACAPALSDEVKETACLQDPPAYTQGFTDAAAMVIGGGGASPVKITYDAHETTPYMSGVWCRQFKTTPMKVKWPDGTYSSRGTLATGQQIELTCKSTKPLMCSMDKWNLDSSNGSSLVGNVYRVLRITPLILFTVEGVESHADATPTDINFGIAGIDYQTVSKWDVMRYSQTQKALNTWDTAGGAAAPNGRNVTDPEAGVEPIATDEKEDSTSMDVDKHKLATPAPKLSLTQMMAKVFMKVQQEEDEESLASTVIVGPDD